MRIQRPGAKKALASGHKMNMGGNVVALGGERHYTQNKETNEKTGINYEQGRDVMCA